MREGGAGSNTGRAIMGTIYKYDHCYMKIKKKLKTQTKGSHALMWEVRFPKMLMSFPTTTL